MVPRIALFATIILALALLPGCPGAPSALVGAWVITEVGGTKYGLELNADGTATPFMVDSTLSGTFTWESDENRVLFHQLRTDANRVVWAALIISDTSLSGAWVVWNGSAYGGSKTFSAAKQ